MNYVLLKRAFNNFGDYLIAERAEKIIRENCPGINLLIGDASQTLDLQFTKDVIDDLSGVIIAGGPGIRNNAYPQLYPLSKDIFNNQIPVFILGGGSKLKNNITEIMPFDKETDYFFKYLNRFAPIGCRDIYTANILDKLGYKSTINGCPAWYDIEYFNKRLSQNDKYKKIIFSVPGNEKFFQQFTEIIYYFQKVYPEYEYSISFNHGIEDKKFSKLFSKISPIFKIMDFSGGTSNSSQYDKIDIHIGYRVHTHIYFLSHRKPTILLSEDSRGIGISETLGSPEIICWDHTGNNGLIKYFNPLKNRFKNNIYDGKKTAKKLVSLFDELNKKNFLMFNDVFAKMEYYYENNMKQYIQKYIK